jgi:FAD/FMN-containing dehydrogenase
MPIAQADPAAVAALKAELIDLIGERFVRDDETSLEKASTDGSHLSPVIRSQFPLGRAQLVAYPTSSEQIAAVVGAAVRHGVPITPRGLGTANYGQTLPMAGGLVLDMSRAREIVEIGEGFITCEPGVRMSAIESAAEQTRQQVLMYPSSVYSTVGGFVSGGSGGTGSIEHGMLHSGFVTAIDVVHAVPDAQLIHIEGEATEPYLHKYGTAGIIARVTVRLEPLRDWRSLYASYADFHGLLASIPGLSALNPIPRLISGDPAELAAALPTDPAIPPGRASLRIIVEASAVPAATEIIEENAGRVEDVRPGVEASMQLSMQSYNHAIEWLQKRDPDTWFHVEVAGDGLIDRHDELVQVYEEGMLHIEGQRGRPIGMLAGHYRSPEDVWAGFDRIEALGINFHNPHQWFVDYEPEATRALAATTDPDGLLNPGKLVAPNVRTGSQR